MQYPTFLPHPPFLSLSPQVYSLPEKQAKRPRSPSRSPLHSSVPVPPNQSSYNSFQLPYPDPHPPPFLPQTIEHALICSQQAVANYLITTDRSHARVELPMGRSRKFWYRMSPPAMATAESTTLALHFATMFEGLKIAIIVNHVPADIQGTGSANLVDIGKGEEDGAYATVEGADVIIVGGVEKSQWPMVEKFLARAGEQVKAIVLLNCCMDVGMDDGMEGYDDVFVCRALDKVAVLKDSVGTGWAIFIEIAVFEYEWIGNKEEGWIPTQRSIDLFATAQGTRKRGISGYYESRKPGSEAGFWPFMTLSSVPVLPIDGTRLSQKNKLRTVKKNANKRPFGFF